ncbi:MAG: cytochrome C oxidase subunit IV family protein [Fluviicola sp.]|jgi:cytochrome c oxidase subunit 4
MERDDIIEYSLHAHHNEEQGKKIRRKIWVVTAILTVITLIEVLVGMKFGRSSTTGAAWLMIKWGYIVLTLVKAGYIVLTFMHLGDEKKWLKWVILIPYFVFIIYLVFISITEANAVHKIWTDYGG